MMRLSSSLRVRVFGLAILGSCIGLASACRRDAPSGASRPADTLSGAKVVPTPSAVVPNWPEVFGQTGRIATDYTHSCAVDQHHRLWCWGGNGSGQIGNGTHSWNGRPEQWLMEFHHVPVPYSGYEFGAVASVACGGRTCALTIKGELYCWGQLETVLGAKRTFSFDDTPQPRKLPLPARSIEVVGGDWCAILTDNSLWCSGPGAWPYHPSVSDEPPSISPVSSLGKHVKSLTGGNRGICALLDDHSVWCWGDNGRGQVGAGDQREHPVPVRLDLPPVVLVAGRHSIRCAVTTEKEIWCWGVGRQGRSRDPPDKRTSKVRLSPARIAGGIDAVQLAFGYDVMYVLDRQGRLWAALNHKEWGALLVGTRVHDGRSDLLVRVKGLTDVQEITAHGDHACALLADESVWCWGNGGDYILGTRTKKDQPDPVRVVFPSETASEGRASSGVTR